MAYVTLTEVIKARLMAMQTSLQRFLKSPTLESATAFIVQLESDRKFIKEELLLSLQASAAGLELSQEEMAEFKGLCKAAGKSLVDYYESILKFMKGIRYDLRRGVFPNTGLAVLEAHAAEKITLYEKRLEESPGSILRMLKEAEGFILVLKGRAAQA